MKQKVRALRLHSLDRAPASVELMDPDLVGKSQIGPAEQGPFVPGQVVIQAEYSSLNYKDALAVTGKAPILKKYPLIPGIDVAGEIIESQADQFKVGQKVLITGCGLGEEQDGGFAEIVRAPESAVVPLPKGLSPREAMILGTAGFTAALSLYRMEQNGQQPDQGPIVVTGASGGVGSFSVHLLAQRGYQVIAVSGKPEQRQTLLSLGASEVISPEKLGLGHRPLEKATYAGAIDNVGGEMLSGLSRHIGLWGNIACVGLAGGIDLKMTVMPFILRGVSLLGISSNNTPRPLRLHLWKLLAAEWKPKGLESFTQETLSLEQIPLASENMLQRKTTYRQLVKLKEG